MFSFDKQKQVSHSVINKTIFEKDLFDSDEIISITLKGGIRQLLNDRADNPASHSVTLFYRGKDSSEVSIPVQMKTRGHFRKLKENCNYPPLLIQFQKSEALQSTIFKEQNNLKLVMPCKGDEYVIREWLVYKIYNLVTPLSFRARLVKVKLEDTRNNKNSDAFYGILLEDEIQMAKRSNMTIVKTKTTPEQLQVNAFLKMAVFEYLIGNTDWSIQFLQNIKLLNSPSQSRNIAVPYDFDHAGIVDAPYANPAEELLMRSVKERRYRGYCVPDLKIFDSIIAFYNQLKNDIYKVYTSCTYLSEKQIKSTISYLDDFYVTINNSKAWQRDFSNPCDKKGTGNVVIKGLKED